MNIEKMSSKYSVRRLGYDDIDIIYNLCKDNKTFYEYHQPFVTKKSIEDDMKALPPNKTRKDKYYLGFFLDDVLVAIIDFIIGYPDKTTCMLGLFMVTKSYQNQGVGSFIIKELIRCLKEEKILKIRVGVDKENTQSNNFWKKNKFVEICSKENYIVMERTTDK